MQFALKCNSVTKLIGKLYNRNKNNKIQLKGNKKKTKSAYKSKL